MKDSEKFLNDVLAFNECGSTIISAFLRRLGEIFAYGAHEVLPIEYHGGAYLVSVRTHAFQKEAFPVDLMSQLIQDGNPDLEFRAWGNDCIKVLISLELMYSLLQYAKAYRQENGAVC